MILNFTNPFDNDTLLLPCNLPFGVYLALEVEIIMATSFPVKTNTWYDGVKMCRVRAILSTHSDMQKNVKTNAADCSFLCSNKLSRI